MSDPSIPTATWTPIAPGVQVWHNHGYSLPLSRVGEGLGTVRITVEPEALSQAPKPPPDHSWLDDATGPVSDPFLLTDRQALAAWVTPAVVALALIGWLWLWA